ncbi:MAG: ATP-dependent helicase [Deltaproteobacteria bacterium]|jgi:DNA helicase-2/ATP-dependent DNA helicase PcrA|nr:ATP-dependent helicase [Deltaproteobacteria bacterium]
MTQTSQPLDLTSQLNESQIKATTHLGGPLLIIAGAGSGKTRTLVHRVAWLVNQGFEASSILLVTFTRKAATEMLNRCQDLVGATAGRVTGGTFHSIANSLLRRYASFLGYTRGFGILDRDDSESLVGRLRQNNASAAGNPNFPKKNTIMNIISQSVNCGLSIKELIKTRHHHLVEFSEALNLLGQEYQEEKKISDLMDFDDLLINLEKLLSQNEDIRREVAGRFTHILVDEYQDTNPIQARLTHLIGRDHGNVTAVGDEAQSIYSFRGADFRNIMDFPNLFPGTTVLKLEDNYRSRPEVLSVANHLLTLAREKYDKTLQPNRQSGLKPKLIITGSLRNEAELVFTKIASLIQSGVSLSDIAVLFRAASHSFELEALLIKNRLPFVKHGGRKFVELPHVKDYFAFLRLSVNPHDAVSLARVLSLLHGLGAKSVEKVLSWLQTNPGALDKLHQAPVANKAKNSLHQVSALFEKIGSSTLSPADTSREVLTFYQELLKELYPDDYPGRQDDLNEASQMVAGAANLTNLMADLTLDPPAALSKERSALKAFGSPDHQDELTLSTIHSAKGLEWKHLFIISAVDGRFPSPYSLKTAAAADEELRLMYVAVTRACDELTVTMPMEASMMSSFSAHKPAPSRFFMTIPFDKVDVFQNYHPVGPQALNSSLSSQDARYHEDTEQYYGTFSQPPENYDSISEYGIFQTPKVTSAPKGSPVDAPVTGQRVKHPVFGNGRILKVSNQKATIDFDLYGLKHVMIAYAKLTQAES